MSNYSAIVTSKVLKAIKDNGMLSTNCEVIVGFSGGADSVCLLHVLFTLREKLNVTVKAAHVNHGIRGNEAGRDEAFAKEFCSKFGIEFHSQYFDCVHEANITGESLEECGRRIRYAYFNSLASENSKIATAHNANDNAETVIFNLARGTALKGVCGIPCVRENIIRPLIYCTRQEIELYCNENGLEYVTDSTNLSDEYSRNKIRHKILPVLEELNSSAVENISAFCFGARQVDEYVRLQAEDALSEAFLDTDTYDAAVLKKLHPAVLNEAVCVAYERFAHSLLDRKKITAVSALIFDTGRLQLYGQNYVEVVKNQLRFFKKTSVAPAETVYIDAFGKYTFGEYTVDFTKITDYSSKVNNGFLYNYVDCDKIKGKLFLRTRCEGDRVKLFKRNVSKTLKKLFCEYNIPVEKRNTLPVLCDDEGIVWIYGIGTVARCCADNKSSNIIYVEGENNG